jgi:hypothetical protein
MKTAESLLKEKQEEQQKIVGEINGLSQQISQLNERKQALLQEALRIDGAIQVLKELK